MGSAVLTSSLKGFRNPELRYTVSGRDILPEIRIGPYVTAFFPFIALAQVESIFGFVEEAAPLYGGRMHQPQEAFHAGHLAEMAERGIHLSLPMTNHYFDRAAYEASRPVLAAHHRAGNSVIFVDDEFARQVRQDFPLYRRKASVIKSLSSPRRLTEALELYDTVVLPMDLNDDLELLRSLEPKSRFQIFANANCAYTCPAKICYRSVSRINRGEVGPEGFQCSKTRLERETLGPVFFDVERYAEMGYRSFKLVPVASLIAAGRAVAREMSLPAAAR